MKKNLTRAMVLCSVVAVGITACNKEKAPTPDELNRNITAYTNNLDEDGKVPDSEDSKTADKENKKSAADKELDNSEGKARKSTKVEGAAGSSSTEEKKDTKERQRTENSSSEEKVKKEISYAISEETKTYIDDFGIQTIEKKYVIPYDADIKDIAPALITTNAVQYGIDSIVSPQSYEEKKISKEIIADTEEAAKKFDEELEYNETDGKGILKLDKDSVKVELNKNDRIPSGVSIVKSYTMSVKDQDKVPQTVKQNGITYYQSSVSWADMGDPGTGINGTEGDSGYGTYNTVASSWKATVTYSGTKYTEDKDYKGTATYIGKILMNNSPTRNYTVTYKPNTMVSNASGIYYNNYMNNMYSQENAKLVETGASDLMGMYTTESAVKIPMIFTLLPWALLYLITMAVAYVAFRVWKKSNESPEELVGTAVSEEDIPVDDNE